MYTGPRPEGASYSLATDLTADCWRADCVASVECAAAFETGFTEQDLARSQQPVAGTEAAAVAAERLIEVRHRYQQIGVLALV